MANIFDNLLKQFQGASSAAQTINSPKFAQEVDDTVDAVKIYGAAQLAFQALAAFSAVGILIVQIQAMKDRRRPRRVMASNGRRKRAKRS